MKPSALPTPPRLSLVKTGLAFLDGGTISGPVVGAVSALADFAHTLYLLGMEYRASKAVNRSLAEGNLDIRLFKTYPLMGCYMLCSATLSDLIPIDSFGTPGWMDYIEHQHKSRLYADLRCRGGTWSSRHRGRSKACPSGLGWEPRAGFCKRRRECSRR